MEQIQLSTRLADARTIPVARVAETKPSYADEVNTEEYLKILEQEMTAIVARQTSTVTSSSTPPISGSCPRREGRAQMLKFICQILGG